MEQRKNVSVNDLCPCGSGLKYKKCCLDKDQSQGFRSNKLFLVIGVAVLLGGVAIWQSSTSDQPVSAPVSTPIVPAEPATPEPWHYDRTTNRHWDPNHKHWHTGPPPSNRDTTPSSDTPAGETPPPWFYDAANNRHWNPDHNHWHNGPPPNN